MDDDRATITPYRDGPYVVRGRFEILDQDGEVIDARRETIALCRCGRSRIKPFCDGSHKAIGFRAPSGEQPPPGRAAGAAPAAGWPPAE